jgi:hypothetical protein
VLSNTALVLDSHYIIICEIPICCLIQKYFIECKTNKLLYSHGIHKHNTRQTTYTNTYSPHNIPHPLHILKNIGNSKYSIYSYYDTCHPRTPKIYYSRNFIFYLLLFNTIYNPYNLYRLKHEILNNLNKSDPKPQKKRCIKLQRT